MPYLYSIAIAVHFMDYTPMRALVMDFNGDEKVLDIKDQFMFGPSLMACPVMKYETYNRSVYLPKQKGWYDLYTNKHYNGGQTITVDAPYEKIRYSFRRAAFCSMDHRWNGATRNLPML